MRRDSRLSVALHVLLHMDEDQPVLTSQAIGAMMNAHPVVVRRTMAGLRETGIVRSEKGHGGGWSLAKPLSAVTLADVYRALGTPPCFSIGVRDESPGCLVEQSVNRALGQALQEAEALLMNRLEGTTVAEVGQDVRRRHRKSKKGTQQHV